MASLYVLGWEVYMAATGYTFAADYIAGMIAAERAAGATPAQLAAARAEYAPFFEQHADPLFRIPMTFAEAAPIVLLVSGALLRNPRFLPREVAADSWRDCRGAASRPWRRR